MGKIVILDENTSNQIAAGEVVERPASVVKELVENSIDAGAGTISVDIKNGGIAYIKVTDNGSGIDEDDVEIAFERHATSKIRSANDLESIATMGFRGEALASIASVSKVELMSRTQKSPHGSYIRIEGGNMKEVKQIGCPVGTSFIIKDLFYNTPARYKFLKKDSTEAGYISDIISRLSLAHPQISFRFTSGGSTVVHTPGNNDLLSVIYSIYGKETSKEVAEMDYAENGVKITGYTGRPEIARANRNYQSVFINGRYVKSKVIASAIDEAYKTYLLKNKFPFIVLKMELNPILVDVNVHPTKMEVRFSNEQDIFRAVYHAVNNALLGKSLVRNIELDQKEKNPFKFEAPDRPSVNYAQQDISFEKHILNEKTENIAYKNENAAVLKNNFSEKENNINQGAIVINRGDGKEAPGASKNQVILEKQPPAEALQDAFRFNPRKPEELPLKPQEIESVPKSTEVRITTEVNEANRDEEIVGIEHKACNEGTVKESIPNPLVNARIIGQAFSTYILLQHQEEVLFIDQHAAHERIMYEKLREKYDRKESLSQMLLSPVVVELTHQEFKFVENEKEFFTGIGFEFESFGNNSIIIRSMPFSFDGTDAKQLFLDVIDFTMNSGKQDFKLVADETLYTVACKAAVKANKKLDDAEIRSLIVELSKLENPYTCPHGRPTIIKITKYEMEKMFKRIV